MKLHIAGGCEEHGRNCFVMEDNGEYIMVDCGKGEDNISFPQLTKEKIMNTRYLFLTHSHMDHSGGIKWIIENGFHGSIISTEETRLQCKITYNNWKYINKNKSFIFQQIDTNLSILWGRSGHCVGSVWYIIEWNGKKILFTGDYKENSPFYFCDRIRNIFADCAVIDCAYGNVDINQSRIQRELLDIVFSFIKEKKTIFLPVPEYGRAFEIIQLIYKAEENIPIYIDHSLFLQTNKKDFFWSVELERIPRDISKWRGDAAVLLVSDSQLRKKDNYELAVKIINKGGLVLLTGYVYPGTNAEKLLKQKLAMRINYPVHMNYCEAYSLVSSNRLCNIILNHHIGKIEDKNKITSNIKTGDTIVF